MKNEIGTLEDYMRFVDEKMDDLSRTCNNYVAKRYLISIG